MHRSVIAVSLLAAGLSIAPGLSAQSTGGAHSHDHSSHGQRAGSGRAEADSSFAALQARGGVAMGVDQYASTHRFDTLPDGGRIEYLLDGTDAEGIARVRSHLCEIAAAFAKGDFRTPAFVHGREVPGTGVMAARRAHIRYAYKELPRGGEIRLTTSDAEALRAIHTFMAFQRQDHRADGHAH